MLSILGNKVPPVLKSGAFELERGISSGKQDYEVDEKQWPVNKPTIKVEARAQTSGKISCRIILLYKLITRFPGEAQYIDDIPLRGDELHGAFVFSNVGNCVLDSVNASRALVKIPKIVLCT